MDLRRGGVHLRVSGVTTLPYLTARSDYEAARESLRGAFLAITSSQFDADTKDAASPDLSAALAWLAKAGRYDLARNLLDMHEAYLEAVVNLKLAEGRQEYDAVVEGHPEYLRDDEDAPVRRTDEPGYPLP